MPGLVNFQANLKTELQYLVQKLLIKLYKPQSLVGIQMSLCLKA